MTSARQDVDEGQILHHPHGLVERHRDHRGAEPVGRLDFRRHAGVDLSVRIRLTGIDARFFLVNVVLSIQHVRATEKQHIP
jgi:hypothetical protein